MRIKEVDLLIQLFGHTDIVRFGVGQTDTKTCGRSMCSQNKGPTKHKINKSVYQSVLNECFIQKSEPTEILCLRKNSLFWWFSMVFSPHPPLRKWQSRCQWPSRLELPMDMKFTFFYRNKTKRTKQVFGVCHTLPESYETFSHTKEAFEKPVVVSVGQV